MKTKSDIYRRLTVPGDEITMVKLPSHVTHMLLLEDYLRRRKALETLKNDQNRPIARLVGRIARLLGIQTCASINRMLIEGDLEERMALLEAYGAEMRVNNYYGTARNMEND